MTDTDVSLLENEAASKPQALFAAPRGDANLIVQPASIDPVSSQFLVPAAAHLSADSDGGKATTRLTVEIFKFAKMPGVLFNRFDSQCSISDRPETIDATIQRDRLFEVLALLPTDVLRSQFADSDDPLFDLAVQETSPSGDPLSAENVAPVFAEFRESLKDELLGGMTFSE